MKTALFFSGMILACLSARSQRVIDVTKNETVQGTTPSASYAITGQIFQPTKFVRLNSGSPFFQDQFMTARMKDDKGVSYASNSVRLNLVDNAVNFLDPATGQELVASIPLKRILFTDTATGSQYSFILGDQIPAAEKGLSDTWLQILVNDTVSLCRQIEKTIQETDVYSSATRQLDILTLDIYFLRMRGSFVRVKNWSDLVTVLKDKKEALDAFIHAHHLKGKTAGDYTQLVSYYNSLSTSHTQQL